LTVLVNELLDQAQLEAGRLKLKIGPVDLREMVDQVAARMTVLAQAKGLRLTCEVAADIPPLLAGDRDRLQQILFNLVSNAVKFTEAGTVQVDIHCSDSTQWAMVVTDTGPGIPVEARTRIFEPFGQVDSSMTRNHDGTGLGLSIVKQLTELMDGQISLESEAGQVSTLTVRLPLSQVRDTKN
jgi:signal transduction histidine kinase